MDGLFGEGPENIHPYASKYQYQKTDQVQSEDDAIQQRQAPRPCFFTKRIKH